MHGWQIRVRVEPASMPGPARVRSRRHKSGGGAVGSKTSRIPMNLRLNRLDSDGMKQMKQEQRTNMSRYLHSISSTRDNHLTTIQCRMSVASMLSVPACMYRLTACPANEFAEKPLRPSSREAVTSAWAAPSSWTRDDPPRRAVGNWRPHGVGYC
jgi:hypothetical protein